MCMRLDAELPIGDTLQGVGTISDSLTNNGTLSTVTAVFIVLTIILLLIIAGGCVYIYKKTLQSTVTKTDNISNISNEIMEQMLTQLSKQVASLNQGQEHIQKEIKTEVEGVKKEIMNEDKVGRDIVRLYLDTNTIFKDASSIVLNTLKAYRVAIYVFHNGNSSSHGLPFFKMSCIYELFLNKKTHSNRGRGHINMPLHLFFEIINELFINTEYKVSNVDYEVDEKENKAVLEYIGTSSSKSFFMLGIRDINDILCGFTVVEFIQPTDFNNPEIYDKIKDAIEVMNGSVKYIISNDDFKQDMNIETTEAN